jgi:hypothetical protein
MERSTIFQFGKPSISMGHLSHGYVTNSQWLTKNAWYHDRTPQIEGGFTVLGLNRTMSNSLVFAGRSHAFFCILSRQFLAIYRWHKERLWLDGRLFCHWCHRNLLGEICWILHPIELLRNHLFFHAQSSPTPIVFWKSGYYIGEFTSEILHITNITKSESLDFHKYYIGNMACDPRTNGLEFTEEQTTIAASRVFPDYEHWKTLDGYPWGHGTKKTP